MNITMPRGDIRHIKFDIVDSNDETYTQNFDEIYFTVKKTANDRYFLFQKKLSDGTITKEGDSYTLTINAADTDGLCFGKYAFDIELLLGDVIKQTTVGDLILTEEITNSRNE